TNRYPPSAESGRRAARQVWPSGWISTLVSRPLTVVTCGAPERISFHTGALLRGCVACRCCCDCASAASFVLTAGDCAAAIVAAKQSPARSSPAARKLIQLTVVLPLRASANPL